MYETANIALKLFTKVGGNSRNCMYDTAKIALKLSTMVGTNFRNCMSERAKIASWLEEILEIECMKQLKLH